MARTKSVFDSIADAKFPADTALLLDLPPPPENLGADNSIEDRMAVTKAVLSLIRELLAIDWESIDWATIMEQAKHPHDCQPCVFGDLLRTLVAYHFRLVTELIDEPGATIDELALIRMPTVTDLIDDAKRLSALEKASEQHAARANGDFLVAEYGMFVVGWMMLRHVSLPGWWPLLTMEASAHSNLQSLAESLGKHGVGQAAMWLVPEAAKLLSAAYDERADVESREHRPGAFSAIRPGELGPLASRDDAIVRRYGKNSVERVFEQQLALLFQSFGFLVVQTRVGKSTVDLVCIANASESRGTLLVEAKTSRRRYPLPLRDSRALRDYASDVESHLRSLPPLWLVLMIGPEPASTIEPKLKGLETSIALPVRYMPASTAGAIREALPGPIVPYGFLEILTASESVVGPHLAEEIRDRYQRIQEAHRQFTHELTDVWSGD